MQSVIAPEIASHMKILVATPHEPSGAIVSTSNGTSLTDWRDCLLRNDILREITAGGSCG